MAHVEQDLAEINAKVAAMHEVIVEGRGFRAAMRQLGMWCW